MASHTHTAACMDCADLPHVSTAGTVKYSDRYEDPVEKLPSLADAEQKARLNAEFFPNLTWKAFFDGERRSSAYLMPRLCI